MSKHSSSGSIKVSAALPDNSARSPHSNLDRTSLPCATELRTRLVRGQSEKRTRTEAQSVIQSGSEDDEKEASPPGRPAHRPGRPEHRPGRPELVQAPHHRYQHPQQMYRDGLGNQSRADAQDIFEDDHHHRQYPCQPHEEDNYRRRPPHETPFNPMRHPDCHLPRAYPLHPIATDTTLTGQTSPTGTGITLARIGFIDAEFDARETRRRHIAALEKDRIEADFLKQEMNLAVRRAERLAYIPRARAWHICKLSPLVPRMSYCTLACTLVA